MCKQEGLGRAVLGTSGTRVTMQGGDEEEREAGQ